MLYTDLSNFLIFLPLFTSQWAFSDNNIEDDWMQPYNWNHHDAHDGLEINKLADKENNSECLAIAKTGCKEDGVSSIILKKYILNLFNRENLKYDEFEGVYKRSLLFTVTPTKLEQLEQLRDVRDLDTILSEIFSEMKTNVHMSSMCSTFIDSIKINISDETFFTILYVSILIISIWMKLKYDIRFRSLFFFSLFLIFAYGYHWEYIECNREAQLTDMVNTLTKDESTGTLTKVWSFFSEGYDKRTKIRADSKIRMPYCRPDYVLGKYIGGLYANWLESFIIKLNGIESNYITAVLVTGAVGPFLIKWIIYSSITSFFMSSKAPAATPTPAPAPALNSTSQEQVPAIGEDRVSGENLKTILNLISRASLPIDSNGSSVQEIRESPPNPPPMIADEVSSASNCTNAKENSCKHETNT